MNSIQNYQYGYRDINSEVFNNYYTSNVNFFDIGVHRNGNIYYFTNNIFIQTKGSGPFNMTSDATRNYRGLALPPNGNVYAAVSGGDIYKQTDGTGAFVAIGAGTRGWEGATAAPNGDIYACVYNGQIYKQTGGSGTWVSQSSNSTWTGMAATPNGDIYATNYTSGVIFKQTGGTGAFVGIGGITNRAYRKLCYLNGNLHATVYGAGGGIYVQRNLSGDFVAINTTLTNCIGICAGFDGSLYVGRDNDAIYKSIRK